MDATGRLQNFDVPFKKADGQALTLQLNVSRIEIGDSSYFLSYVKVVTAERKVQAELLAGQQLLQATNDRLNQQIK